MPGNLSPNVKFFGLMAGSQPSRPCCAVASSLCTPSAECLHGAESHHSACGLGSHRDVHLVRASVAAAALVGVAVSIQTGLDVCLASICMHAFLMCR